MGDIDIPSLDLNIPSGKPSGGIVARIMEPIESMFSAIGLDSPLFRLLGVAGATGACLYLFKPSAFFESDGRSRPWSLWSLDGPDSDSTSTWVPWWLFAILAGVFFATFV